MPLSDLARIGRQQAAAAAANQDPAVRREAPAQAERWLMAMDTESVRDEGIEPEPNSEGKFPKPIYHQVVAISFALLRMHETQGSLRLEIAECRCGGTEQSTEAELLHGFWRTFEKYKPRLLTWHGRGHDIPVLKLRSMVHGIPVAPHWFKAGDKWSNYGHRYSTDYHCDLMDVLSDHHAASPMTLREASEAVGIPGKINGRGSDVAALWSEGKIGQIRNYGESDVLSLVGLYIRHLHATGQSTPEDHDTSMRSMRDYLEREAPMRQSMSKFLETWCSSDRPRPMFILPQDAKAENPVQGAAA